MNEKNTFSPAVLEFIAHFGEMGGKWGINRIAAQVFAVLYLSPRPLSAAALCDLLDFSRSHIGTALKDLENWRLIVVNRPRGDRSDHYATIDNIWEIARILVEERRNREIEPTRTMLQKAIKMQPANADEEYMHDKIVEMQKLLESLNDLYKDIQQVETQQLVRMLKFGSKMTSLYIRSGKWHKK